MSHLLSKDSYVAIMAGGIGSRFWPKSRQGLPKQFLDILNVGETLIQSTFKRYEKIVPSENIFIVTNEIYKDLVLEQLPSISESQLLLEPSRKNTAPCVAFVAYKLFNQNPNAKIIVAPSDHLIMHEDAFCAKIDAGLDHIHEHDVLLTLGIKPTRPDTGYGYIQYLDKKGKDDVYPVKTFTEKPNDALAQTFLSSGDFLWNSGMFLWKASTIIEAFEKYAPEIVEAFANGDAFWNTAQEPEFIKQVYALCPNISIDYAIMEKAEQVMVIPSEFGWSDLGTWGSLYVEYEKDYLGNAVKGKEVVTYDANGCMIMVPDDKLVVIQGLNDFCVVDTHDVLIVCEKSKEQFIKQITSDLKRNKKDKFL